MPASTLREQLHKDGFVVIRQILTPTQLETLRAAAARTTELGRTGKWPSIRTVGKQFPPWPEKPGPEGIWGIQGLMNPALPDHQAFTDLYFSDAILDICKELMACTDDDLVMELFNMLVRPESDFELRWHRDDIPPTATAEEEMTRLKEPEFHTQYNLPLYDDASLVLVPGSHARPRTDAERGADPYEKNVPNQIAVQLGPGDIAFYNNNIFHRGVYDSSKERMSLHGSVGHAGGSKLRARNVLQHGSGKWVDKCDFSTLDDKARARAEAMRERLVKLGKEAGQVGYSLEG